MTKIPKINLSSPVSSYRVNFNRLLDSVGDLELLNTDSSTTIVAAINSVDSNQGTRLSLTTSDKTNLVSAINELDAELGTITSGAMGTTASTVSTAIAELDGRLDSINNTQLNTQDLYVQGNAQIDGTLTVDGVVNFKAGSAGSVTLGDTNTDNVVFNADVNSHIIPNTDNTYDLGSSGQEWRNLYVDGTANIDNLAADAATVTGDLDVQGVTTLDSATVDGPLSVTGALDVTGALTSSSKAFTVTSTKNPSGTDVNLGDTFSVDLMDSDLIQSMIDSNFGDSSAVSGIPNKVIANSKLANNFIVINGVQFDLGDDRSIDVFDSGSTIPLIKSVMKSVESTGIAYDSARGEFSLASIPNSSTTNSTFSVNGVSGNLGSNITVDIVDSAEVIELARGAVSVTDAGGDGSLTYNSGTGVITYTGPSAADVRAHISAGEGIDFASGVISGEDATTTNKGIASFNSTSFSTSSGSVSIKSGGVSNAQLANSSITVNGSSVSLGGSVDIDAIDSARTLSLIGGSFDALPSDITRSGTLDINATVITLDASNGSWLLKDNGSTIWNISGANITASQSFNVNSPGSLELNSVTDLTLDASADINLDADGGQIRLKDGGTARAHFDVTQSYLRLYTGTSTLNSTWTGDDLTVQGDITSVSDVRTKENITTIEHGLEIVESLRGVRYNKIGNEDKHVGVIAQEVEEVLPEVVKTDDEGMKSVDYGKMVGVLIEAIKDLKAELDELKNGV